MSDLISRTWLLDVVENIIEWDTERDRNRIIHQVRELTPAVQPEQAIKDCRNCKHGRYNDYHKSMFCYNSNDCTDWNLWEPAELPSEQPRKKGKWIEFDSDEDKYDLIKCSCCEHIFTVDSFHWSDRGFVKDDFNFCPICGASMKGESE